jgi:hypothetical protein
MPEDIGLIDLHLHPKGLSKREFRTLEKIVDIYGRCLRICFPTHLEIFSRTATGLRMGGIEC